MFKFILIAALVPAMALSTNVGNCDGKPSPNAVRVDGCSTMPCDIVRGQDAIMNMDFTVGGNYLILHILITRPKVNNLFPNLDNPISSLRPEIIAYALGQTVPYPLSDELNNVCANLGTSQCPLDPTEEATWKFVFFVGMEYPKVDLVLEVNLLDQSDNIVSCFKLEGQVVDPQIV